MEVFQKQCNQQSLLNTLMAVLELQSLNTRIENIIAYLERETCHYMGHLSIHIKGS